MCKKKSAMSLPVLFVSLIGGSLSLTLNASCAFQAPTEIAPRPPTEKAPTTVNPSDGSASGGPEAKAGGARDAGGNHGIATFEIAKREAARVHEENPVTIYCPCRYQKKRVDLESCGYEIHSDAKRAARLEWEHVVPAEAFGQSFAEWREGAESCHSKDTDAHRGRRYKGRRCAKSNPEFARMEGDLYNLWPVIGELNGLRSNYSMEQISGEALSFGGCRAKIQDRKFEPMDQYKGIVARTYMYMDLNYPSHGVISNKNRKLFEAWDRQFPVSAWECRRAQKIASIQGNANQILTARCSIQDGKHEI